MIESIHIDKQIKTLESQIRLLPKGTLGFKKAGKYVKWYITNETGISYLPKSNEELAKTLALKKFYEYQLQDLLHEKNALQSYLKHHQDNKAEHLLSESSQFHSLLSSHYTPLRKELHEWATAAYDKNTKYPDQLIHKTPSGNTVRSKSEALIDIALFFNKIPYRYECSLLLGDITIYPDFTIRHPVTGQTIYWEHFGMMDNPNYSQSAVHKLELYISHGFIPTINLITTYETRDNPLSTELIEKIITHYFM